MKPLPCLPSDPRQAMRATAEIAVRMADVHRARGEECAILAMDHLDMADYWSDLAEQALGAAVHAERIQGPLVPPPEVQCASWEAEL